MPFSKGISGLTELGDDADDAQHDALLIAESIDDVETRTQATEIRGGWLSDDDIEEV